MASGKLLSAAEWSSQKENHCPYTACANAMMMMMMMMAANLNEDG
jgi:hypothetical protein